jgi:hypothetical protein
MRKDDYFKAMKNYNPNILMQLCFRLATDTEINSTDREIVFKAIKRRLKKVKK